MDDTHIWLWKCLKSKRGKNLLESMCNVEYLPSDKDRQLNCDCFGMIFLIVSMFLRHLYCLKRLQGQTHCLDKRPHLLYLFSVVTPLCCTTTLHYYWTTPEATSVFTHSITWDVTKGTCPDWQDILPFFLLSLHTFVKWGKPRVAVTFVSLWSCNFEERKHSPPGSLTLFGLRYRSQCNRKKKCMKKVRCRARE
jgi:hypothetical protein